VMVDSVLYGVELDFPLLPASSISLDPAAFNASANDQPANWCAGSPVYFGDMMQQTANWGSPGQDNLPCEVELDWCKLRPPYVVWGQAGQGGQFTVSGRVRADGLTDLTHGVDDHRRLVAAAGYGPTGVYPGNEAWVWYQGAPNTVWDAQEAGAVGTDEYQATVFCPPQAGEYEFVFRFSDDGGTTWTYCDIDGSANGFSPAQAGDLTVE